MGNIFNDYARARGNRIGKAVEAELGKRQGQRTDLANENQGGLLELSSNCDEVKLVKISTNFQEADTRHRGDEFGERRPPCPDLPNPRSRRGKVEIAGVELEWPAPPFNLVSEGYGVCNDVS